MTKNIARIAMLTAALLLVCATPAHAANVISPNAGPISGTTGAGIPWSGTVLTNGDIIINGHYLYGIDGFYWDFNVNPPVYWQFYDDGTYKVFSSVDHKQLPGGGGTGVWV